MIESVKSKIKITCRLRTEKDNDCACFGMPAVILFVFYGDCG